jgi:hypothetical protein
MNSEYYINSRWSTISILDGLLYQSQIDYYIVLKGCVYLRNVVWKIYFYWVDDQ